MVSKTGLRGGSTGALPSFSLQKEALSASTHTLCKRDWQASSDRVQIVTACIFKLSAVPRQALAAAACRAESKWNTLHNIARLSGERVTPLKKAILPETSSREAARRTERTP